MKILIAVDDSTSSERAVEFVTRMRWPAGSRMIVTTWQPAGVVTAGCPEALPLRVEQHEGQERHQQAVLSRALALLRAAGFATEGQIVEGNARECLIQMIKDQGVDLVVMGSSGTGPLSHPLLGSMSGDAATSIPCSVLIVKPR